jgi:hypothetical protein
LILAEQETAGVIYVQTSIGEFLDKLTILQIKSERINDPAKKRNIDHELEVLERTWQQFGYQGKSIEEDIVHLKEINEMLWEIEDQIRAKEARRLFDDEFIALARRIYLTNDERACIKKEINLKTGSQLLEEKSYSDY